MADRIRVRTEFPDQPSQHSRGQQQQQHAQEPESGVEDTPTSPELRGRIHLDPHSDDDEQEEYVPINVDETHYGDDDDELEDEDSFVLDSNTPMGDEEEHHEEGSGSNSEVGDDTDLNEDEAVRLLMITNPIKPGTESVDKQALQEKIQDMSKGSKFYQNQVDKTKAQTESIAKLKAQAKKLSAEQLQASKSLVEKQLVEVEKKRRLDRWIVCVDMDAFYASCEEVERPDLKKKPMAIGGSSYGGVISTANYVARLCGIRSAMGGHIAKKLCPKLIFLPVNMRKYEDYARRVREVLKKYHPNFYPAGCDEAFLDITDYCNTHNIGPEEAVQRMRDEITATTKLTASAGIACTKTLAKICSNKNKPNGQFYLPNDREKILEFLQTLDVRQVPGIGAKRERELKAFDVKVVSNLVEKLPLFKLIHSEISYNFLLHLALGVEENPFDFNAERGPRKQISKARTMKPTNDLPTLLRLLKERCGEVAHEMSEDKNDQIEARTVTVVYKFDTHKQQTRQRSGPYVSTEAEIFERASAILQNEYYNAMKQKKNFNLRLIGVSVSNFASKGTGRRMDVLQRLRSRSNIRPQQTTRLMEACPFCSDSLSGLSSEEQDAHWSNCFQELKDRQDQRLAPNLQLTLPLREKLPDGHVGEEKQGHCHICQAMLYYYTDAFFAEHQVDCKYNESAKVMQLQGISGSLIPLQPDNVLDHTSASCEPKRKERNEAPAECPLCLQQIYGPVEIFQQHFDVCFEKSSEKYQTESHPTTSAVTSSASHNPKTTGPSSLSRTETPPNGPLASTRSAFWSPTLTPSGTQRRLSTHLPVRAPTFTEDLELKCPICNEAMKGSEQDKIAHIDRCLIRTGDGPGSDSHERFRTGSDRREKPGVGGTKGKGKKVAVGNTGQTTLFEYIGARTQDESRGSRWEPGGEGSKGAVARESEMRTDFDCPECHKTLKGCTLQELASHLNTCPVQKGGMVGGENDDDFSMADDVVLASKDLQASQVEKTSPLSSRTNTRRLPDHWRPGRLLNISSTQSSVASRASALGISSSSSSSQAFKPALTQPVVSPSKPKATFMCHFCRKSIAADREVDVAAHLEMCELVTAELATKSNGQGKHVVYPTLDDVAIVSNIMAAAPPPTFKVPLPRDATREVANASSTADNRSVPECFQPETPQGPPPPIFRKRKIVWVDSDSEDEVPLVATKHKKPPVAAPPNPSSISTPSALPPNINTDDSNSAYRREFVRSPAPSPQVWPPGQFASVASRSLGVSPPRVAASPPRVSGQNNVVDVALEEQHLIGSESEEDAVQGVIKGTESFERDTMVVNGVGLGEAKAVEAVNEQPLFSDSEEEVEKAKVVPTASPGSTLAPANMFSSPRPSPPRSTTQTTPASDVNKLRRGKGGGEGGRGYLVLFEEQRAVFLNFTRRLPPPLIAPISKAECSLPVDPLLDAHRLLRNPAIENTADVLDNKVSPAKPITVVKKTNPAKPFGGKTLPKLNRRVIDDDSDYMDDDAPYEED
ncbi:hypothetical protein HDV05_006282 [Chytridiales sp. JEL 0842]|nr:hypothetical protein HDV05_006282 [Chytridiales sp. JEL 0842]